MNIDKMHQIEVDGEVYDFLKKNAEPFVDTPNKVLRRFLPLHNIETESQRKDDIPEFRPGVPEALAQILQVMYLVKNKDFGRVQATREVAEARGITYQAVIDKYTRQLGKKAYEIDELLTDSNMNELKEILKEEFPRFVHDVDKILDENG